MTPILVVFALNAMLLLLHEIESAFEREWELLRLPGRIGGFLILHVPVILLVLYGLIELHKGSTVGTALGLVLGWGGIVPVLVHEVFLRRDGHFDRVSSRIVMYSNLATGVVLILLSLSALVRRT